MSDEGSTAATWVSDAWRSTRDELALFLRTLRDFVRTPHALMRAWVAGDARPMNPLGYLGVCFLVAAPAALLLSWRSEAHFQQTTQQLHLTAHMVDVLRAIEPYAGVLVAACLTHAFLRLLGAKGPLSRTLGALLYVEGPDAVVRWLVLPYRYFYGQLGVTSDHGSTRDFVIVGLAILVSGYFGVEALSGAHGVRRWKVVVALVVAVAALLVVFSVGAIAWLEITGALPRRA